MQQDDVNQDGQHECGVCALANFDAAMAERAVQIELTDHSRRDFVSLATLSAIALTLTACGTGELTAEEKLLAAPRPTPTLMQTPTPPPGANQIGVNVSTYPALATVGSVAKVSANPPVAVARTASGFVAYSLRCPHQGTTVNIVTTTSWKCPDHNATFNAFGAWTGGQNSTALVARTVAACTNNTYLIVNLT